MATYTTNGGIKKIATGDESGTWGTSTNTNFDIIDRLAVGVGNITLSGTTHTLTTSDGATSDGQYHVLVLGGSPSGTNTITVSPSDAKRLYIVKNGSGQSAIFTQGSGSNVTVANGASAIIYCDGAGASAAVVDLSSTLTGLLPLTGGTLTGDLKLNDSVQLQLGSGQDLRLYHDGSNSFISDAGIGDLYINGSNNIYLRDIAGNTMLQLEDTGSGGVVRLYYETAQKLHTMSTGVNVIGIVQSDGISVGDNDSIYLGASNDLQIVHDGTNSYITDQGTGNLRIKGQQIDILTGSGENAAYFETNGTARLYYDNAIKIATTSTGVDITGTALTDGVTVDGPLDIEEVKERVETGTSTTGTLNFNFTDGAIVNLTSNQTANRTINFRGDASNSLNSIMSTGQSMTCTVIAKQGTTAYYFNAYQVDGSSVTPEWSGGSAPTGGNASSLDVYTFTIIKTASATFTVLASQTQFA